MPYTTLRDQPFSEVMGADASRLFGWEAAVRERIDFVSTGVSRFLLSAVVPAGKLWVIPQATAMDLNSACPWINLNATDGVTNFQLDFKSPCPAATPVNLTGTLVLVPGDRLTAYFRLPPLNDLLTLSYTGYQMTMP